MVSLADGADFYAPAPGPLGAGMLIGSVYRVKVTNIAGHEGLEVYPTIEVIDRLYPPIGQETRFPIPIDITQEELELALSGRFVTRVIYLEDPEHAFADGRTARRTDLFRDSAGRKSARRGRSLGPADGHSPHRRTVARRRRTGRHVSLRFAALAEIPAGGHRASDGAGAGRATARTQPADRPSSPTIAQIDDTTSHRRSLTNSASSSHLQPQPE